MILDFRVAIILGIFTVVCISLIIFNLMVTHTNIGRRRVSLSARMARKWHEIIYKQTERFIGRKGNETQHNKLLIRKLINAEELVAYSDALNYIKSEFPEEYCEYMDDKHETFQKIANKYRKRTTVERACFAEFVCEFPVVAGSSYEQISDTLISYIASSSIHCRTNVIRALCSIGNVAGVGNALQMINDKRHFIHNHVLTDELAKFKGDKDELAKHLWTETLQWNDNLQIAVIQFILRISGEYCEAFLPVLQDSLVGSEVRIAIIRYYMEYFYEPANTVLSKLVLESKNTNLASEAALALSMYPSQDTFDTLKKALYSPEWNIRYNASIALVRLGDKVDIAKLVENESEYAKEIVIHMMERERVLQLEGMDGETVSV